MVKPGGMSARKAWILVIASLVDDAAVLALVFLGLWYFHIKITWVIIVVVIAAVAAFMVVMHKAVVPAIRRRQVTGREGMVGLSGRVTETLDPVGTVMVKDEYWKAQSLEGKIDKGQEVEVADIQGLTLKVRAKKP